MIDTLIELFGRKETTVAEPFEAAGRLSFQVLTDKFGTPNRVDQIEVVADCRDLGLSTQPINE